jgi:hypothetical protein
MTDHPSTQISDNPSTPGAEMAAPFEQRLAARTLTHEADDDNADAAYDEMDRIDALIVSTAAHTPRRHTPEGKHLSRYRIRRRRTGLADAVLAHGRPATGVNG